MTIRISGKFLGKKKPVIKAPPPSKCFKKQKTACVVGQKRKDTGQKKQIMNISEYLDKKRKASPQLQKAPNGTSKPRAKKSHPKGVTLQNCQQKSKLESFKSPTKRSQERSNRPRRRIEIIKSPPIKKKFTNWLRKEETSGKWVRQVESPNNLVTSGFRAGPRRIYMNSPPHSKLGESSRSQTPLKYSLKTTIAVSSNTGVKNAGALKKARSQVAQSKCSVSPNPARKRQSRVTLSRLKKSLLLQKKDDHPLYGSCLEQSSHKLEQFRSCQNNRNMEQRRKVDSVGPAKRGNGPQGEFKNKPSRVHKSPLVREPEMRISQCVGSPPNYASGSSRVVKQPFKKSKTQNYGREASGRSHRKVIKYSLKDFNSSEHQFKKRRNQMKSVEVVPRTKNPNKSTRQTPFQKWPSWKNRTAKPAPKNEGKYATKPSSTRPTLRLEPVHFKSTPTLKREFDINSADSFGPDPLTSFENGAHLDPLELFTQLSPEIILCNEEQFFDEPVLTKSVFQLEFPYELLQPGPAQFWSIGS